MKRIFLVLIISLGIVSFASAQVNFGTFQTDMETFATAVAGTLASTASSAGLSWSQAYIGQFPHFGVGVSVGASLIPFSAVTPILNLVGATIPAGLEFIQQYGIPLPAAAIDARIGGFGIPFDIGLKFGYLPPEAKKLLGSVNVDYLLAGADFRLALLKDQGLSPALSIGVGYTYFKGSVGLPGVLSGPTDVDISAFMQASGYPAGSYALHFTSPDLNFNWQSNVIEAKVQLSKQILLFTPSIGMSAAYGISSAGGGLASTMTYTGAGATEAQMQQAFVNAGYPAPTSQGFSVSSKANDWAFRAYGGLNIAILFLNLDVEATYNIVSGSFGGSVGLRIQF